MGDPRPCARLHLQPGLADPLPLSEPGASNRTLLYKVDGLNQYQEVGPNPYSYDPNGNLTGDGITTYTYDVENRLVAASNGAALVYDPLGRLPETSGPDSAMTRFQYDGDKLIAEYDGAGSLLKRYVHGPGTDNPVAVYEGPALGLANPRYLLADERPLLALGPGAAPRGHVRLGMAQSIALIPLGYFGAALRRRRGRLAD